MTTRPINLPRQSGARQELKVKNLTKRFGGVTALDDVSFTVPAGELVAVIGPNGAGKSTLLEILSGGVRPDAGHVFLGDDELTRRTSPQIVVKGLVRSFQLNRIFPRMTVLENVMVGCHTRVHSSSLRSLFLLSSPGEAEMRDIAEECLGRVGMAGRGAELAGVLSYGQKRLLELARLLAAKPTVMVLDEPGAGLSRESLQRVHELLSEANDSGVTILLVEHRMPLVVGLSRRVIVLNEGRLLADGPTREVMNNEEVIVAYVGKSLHLT